MKNSFLFVKRTLTSLAFAATMIALLTYCSKEETTPVDTQIKTPVPQAIVKQSVLKSATITTATLYAGQNTNVGRVEVSQIDNDPVNFGPDALQVTYKMTNGTLKTLHLWLGTDLSVILNNGDNPQLNKFPFTATANKSEFSFIIPFSSVNFPYSPCSATTLLVAAKADVDYKDNNGNLKTDGAWASKNEIFEGKNWSTYFTYELKDETPPTASNPSTINVECEGDVPVPNIAVVTDAKDNCSGLEVAYVSDSNDGNNCPKTITRTYSVTDAAKNSITVNQTIIVHDVTPPKIEGTIAASEIEGCSETQVPAALNTMAELTGFGLKIEDNCTSALKVTSADVTTPGCPIVVTRTYTVTDDCGNHSSVAKIFRIVDKTAPVLVSNTAEVTLTDCGVIPEAQFVKPTFTDNCNGLVTINKFGDDVVDNSVPGYILYKRTWTASDACGNTSSSVSQVVKVPICGWSGGTTGNPEWKPAAGTGWAYDYVTGDAISLSTETNTLDRSGNNWGWTNGTILNDGKPHIFRLYVCAGKNDLSKGKYVGDVTVTYSGSTVKVEYNITPLCNISVAHIYIGYTKLPYTKKGVMTAAPGQFPYKSGQLPVGTTKYTKTVEGFKGEIYVAAHAEIVMAQ